MSRRQRRIRIVCFAAVLAAPSLFAGIAMMAALARDLRRR